jgi:hypothetical protein
MQKVDEAVRQFSLMADAADEIERQYAAGVGSREAMRQQGELAKAGQQPTRAACSRDARSCPASREPGTARN